MPDRQGRILRLRDPRLTPPHGFTVKVPQTGLVVNGGHLRDLVFKVRDHLIVAKLPVPMPVEVWVEDLLASRLPADLITFRDFAAPAFSTVMVKGPKLSEAAAVRATLQLLHAVQGMAKAAGRAFAPATPEEADRRAKICKGCPEMAGEPGCYSCTIKSIMDPWTGFHGTDDPGLGTCHCDGTLLKALVRSADSGCNLRTPGVQYPKNCWRTDDGANPASPDA